MASEHFYLVLSANSPFVINSLHLALKMAAVQFAVVRSAGYYLLVSTYSMNHSDFVGKIFIPVDSDYNVAT